MTINRRDVLTGAAVGLSIDAFASTTSALAAHKTIKAVAFDGFPILDPRPVVALSKEMYGPNGEAFFTLFRTRLFEYQWLRALGGRYRDFFSIIDDAHLLAADQLELKVQEDKRAQLRDAFLKLNAWPDVATALQTLKGRGLKLAFLSNMTPAMLEAGITNSGLENTFDHVLSTDVIQTYKPDPRAYQLAVEAFNLPKQQIAFAAFAGWDVADAAWFGFPTVWVNRLNAKPEMLGAQPDAAGNDLGTLMQFIAERG